MMRFCTVQRFTWVFLILVTSKVYAQGSFQKEHTTEEQLPNDSEENEDDSDSVEVNQNSFVTEEKKFSQPKYLSKSVVESNNNEKRPQQLSWSMSQPIQQQPIRNLQSGRAQFFGHQSQNEMPQKSATIQNNYQIQPNNENQNQFDQAATFGQMSGSKQLKQPNLLSNIHFKPPPLQQAGHQIKFRPPPPPPTGRSKQSDIFSQSSNSFPSQNRYYSPHQPSRSNFGTLSNPHSYFQNQLFGFPNQQQMQGLPNGIVQSSFISPLVYIPSAGYVLASSPLLMHPPHPYIDGFNQNNNILGPHPQRPPKHRQPPRKPKREDWNVNQISSGSPANPDILNQQFLEGYQVQDQQFKPQFSQNFGQIKPINKGTSSSIPSKMNGAQKMNSENDITIDNENNTKEDQAAIHVNTGKLNQAINNGKIENKNPGNLDAGLLTVTPDSNIKKDQAVESKNDQHPSNEKIILAETPTLAGLGTQKLTPNKNINPNILATSTMNNSGGMQASERDGIPDNIGLEKTISGTKRDKGTPSLLELGTSNINLPQSETMGHSNSFDNMLTNNQNGTIAGGARGHFGNGQELYQAGSKQSVNNTPQQGESTTSSSQNLQILSQTDGNGLSQNGGATNFNHIKLITLPGRNQKINLQTMGAPAKNGVSSIQLLTMPSRSQSMYWNGQQNGSSGNGQEIMETFGNELHSQNGRNTQLSNTGGSGGSFNQIRYVPGSQTQANSRLSQIKFLPHSFIVTPIKTKIPQHGNTGILDESMDLFDDSTISYENEQKQEPQPNNKIVSSTNSNFSPKINK